MGRPVGSIPPTIATPRGDSASMFDAVGVDEREGWTVVHLKGELDHASCPRVRKRLIEVQADRGKLIAFDMSEVAFLSSDGVGLLIGALKRANGLGGRICVLGLSQFYDSVFRRMGLHKVLTIVTTEDEACAWLMR